LACLVGMMTRFLSGRSCPVALITRFLSGKSCPMALMTTFLSCQSCPVALITRFLSGVSCGADDQISAYILNNAVILPWGVLYGERRGSVRWLKSPSLSQALIYIFPGSAVVRPYFSALKIMYNIHTASQSMNYLT